MKKINPMIYGIIPAIVFGFSFMFTKVALNTFEDPFHLLALRFSFAVVTLSLLIALKIVKVNFKGKKMKLIMVLTLFQPISYFIFETLGIKLSSASQAGVMIAFIPIAVSILAVIFLGEKTNIKQMSFVALSIAGVLIINSNVKFTLDSLSGSLLLLGAVVSAAIYQILSRKLSESFTATEITYLMMWVGAIVFNAIALFNAFNDDVVGDYFRPLFNFELLGALAYLGILSSVVAFFIINYVLSHVEATKAAILANLTTIVAILAGVLVLGESFGAVKFIGSVLILVGVYGTTKVKI